MMTLTKVILAILVALSFVSFKSSYAQQAAPTIFYNCNTARLYRSGVCRRGRNSCLPTEVELGGSNFCNLHSVFWNTFYTRCLSQRPCCMTGGSCRAQCLAGESTLGGAIDCSGAAPYCCARGTTTGTVPGTVPGTIPGTVPGTKPSQSVATRQGVCGVQHIISTRIVGGAAGRPGSWPWAVRLIYPGLTGNGFCSGVLVDDDTVITVAHCVSGTRPGNVKVMLGDYDSTRLEQQEEVVDVRSIEVNPNYRPGQRGNDMALLKLTRSATFTPFTYPGCLPDPSIPIMGMSSTGKITSSTQCYVAGWGLTSNGTVSATLQTARVSLMNREMCQAVLQATSQNATPQPLPVDILCTDTSTSKADACQYDDGAMLACLDANNRYSILGLVSQYTCGRLPTLYTNVAKYTEAILTRL